MMRILASLSLILSIIFTYHLYKGFPLPKERMILKSLVPDAPISKENLFFFWDYSFWLTNEELAQIEIVLPYEKGPPYKLLSQIVFRHRKSHKLEWTLFGKRPRQYESSDVLDYFKASLSPSLWKYSLHLMKEAGIALNEKINSFYLQPFEPIQSAPFHLVGMPPWVTGSNGRFFFLSPEGHVFQAFCPSPCAFQKIFQRLSFVESSQASYSERKRWAQQKILERLRNPAHANPDELRMDLVSLLTIDPRDPEAFFHLGKLAQNRETLSSILRYAEDVGMDRAQRLELKSTLENFRPNEVNAQ